MKSFFKKESKEDKERKRLEKNSKNSEVSFNSTLSPDCIGNETVDVVASDLVAANDSGMHNDSNDNVGKSMSLKLQSSSKSSIDSQHQVAHPPLLPKPKKGT